MNIKTIKTDTMSWIDIKKLGQEEIDYLRNNFHFHPLNLQDCQDPGRRPKVDKYDDYLFLTLKIPKYYKGRKETEICNLNICVGKNYLITIHDEEILPLKKLSKDLNLHDKLRKKYLGKEPAFLLYQTINQLLEDGLRMLDHIGDKIDRVEKQIYKNQEKKTVEEISIVEREIIDYRKIAKPQKIAMQNLKKIDGYFIPERLKIYFEDLAEKTEKIWEILEGQKDTITALQSTNESLLSSKINETMRALTILSMIMLPLNVIIGIYARGAYAYTPFANHPYAFWVIIALLQVFIVGIIVHFWRRGRL